MNGYDALKHADEMRRRFQALEHQVKLLEALHSALGQLWSDDELSARGGQLERDVARAVIRNCQAIWDAQERPNPLDKAPTTEPKEGRDETHPF